MQSKEKRTSWYKNEGKECMCQGAKPKSRGQNERTGYHKGK